jgi:membrane carboxypeptidase/penicillin-binding protein PbpC
MKKKIVTMHEAYVSFKLAKLLKEAGFDWQVSGHWVETNKEKETAIVLPKRPCFYNLMVVDVDCDIFSCCIKNWNVVEDKFQFYYSAPLLAVARDWARGC